MAPTSSRAAMATMRILRAGSRRVIRKSGEQDGYTLLELLVVLAIVSIIAALVTGYTPSRRSSRDLKLETYRLEMDLRAARSQAIYTGQPVTFAVDIRSSAWRFATQPEHKVAEGISLTVYTGRKLLSGSSTGSIAFFPNGQSSGGKVTLQSAGDKREVNIDWLTGRIKLTSDVQ